MAIDTNLGVTYREEFPVAGVNQSSQGFRDNFLALKRATENLQSASSTSTSIVSLSTSIGDAGAIRFSIGFNNNSFFLPTGSPTTGGAQQGMIRQAGGVAEIHDGTAWRTILSVDSLGGVSVPTSGYFLLPKGGDDTRPVSPQVGMLRFSTASNGPEVYTANGWKLVSASGSAGEFEINDGVVNNKLRLLTDPTNPTDAMNLRSFRNIMANAVANQTGGISLAYDTNNDLLHVTPRDIGIQFVGAILGNAVITSLGNVVIETDFGTQTGVSLQQVRDELGRNFITGSQRTGPNATTESGIIVYYDDVNERLEISPKDFSVTLAGAVSGAATISKLGNVTIQTSTNLISGLTVQDEGSATGSTQSVQTLNFTGGAVSVTQSGAVATVAIPLGLTSTDVRDTVGDFVKGSIRDPQTQVDTESGITVNYDSQNNALELGVRDFNVNLTGAVTGTGLVRRLGNVTINTSTDRIAGITLFGNSVQVGGIQTVQALNFTGENVSVSQDGSTGNILISALSDADVRNEVGSIIYGTSINPVANTITETGITVNYDSQNKRVELGVRDFSVTLTGAVTGTTTISKLGNAVLDTSTSLIRGITVADEGVDLGIPQSVQKLNFVGNGVTTTQSGNAVTVSVPTTLTTAQVQDQVGSLIKGSTRAGGGAPTETGITVNYDAQNNTVELGVRDFAVTLTGAVTGTTTISKLNNAVINTSTNLIQGITVSDEGNALGLSQSVQAMNFVGGGVTTTQNGNTVTVSVPTQITTVDVQNQVGGLLKGSIRDNNDIITESGITVNYDAQNNVVELGAREFNIDLTGVIQGSTKISRLNNAVMTTTTTSLITGLTALANGVALSTAQSAKQINFTGNGMTTSQTGNTVTVTVPAGLSLAAVRDEMGTVIKGRIRDVGTGISTPSGINVNYDANTSTIELSPRDVTITLTGPVTGSGTITRLSNVTIATSADFIDGIDVKQNGILLGRRITAIDIIGGGASVNGTTAAFNLTAATNTTQVRNIITGLTVHDNLGISAAYDSSNDKINFSLKPLTIALTGAITGNGVINFNGSATDGNVVITTETGALGIEVRDEGTTKGSAVSTINFVGGGVTSGVSVDGGVATVYVPNSPANEKFLLLDNGSANVPNARRLRQGTGILINDGGPGGDVIISAFNDEIIAKSQIMLNGTLVAERAKINIVASNEIIAEVIDDDVLDRVSIQFFSLSDGWHRSDAIDMGVITDKYGPSIDMGNLDGGIIEVSADMGSLP